MVGNDYLWKKASSMLKRLKNEEDCIWYFEQFYEFAWDIPMDHSNLIHSFYYYFMMKVIKGR